MSHGMGHGWSAADASVSRGLIPKTRGSPDPTCRSRGRACACDGTAVHATAAKGARAMCSAYAVLPDANRSVSGTVPGSRRSRVVLGCFTLWRRDYPIPTPLLDHRSHRLDITGHAPPLFHPQRVQARPGRPGKPAPMPEPMAKLIIRHIS